MSEISNHLWMRIIQQLYLVCPLKPDIWLIGSDCPELRQNMNAVRVRKLLRHGGIRKKCHVYRHLDVPAITQVDLQNNKLVVGYLV